MQHLAKKYSHIFVFNSYLFDFNRNIKVCSL